MAGDIDVGAVHVYQRLVDGLLERAAQVKPDKQIEPPLTEVQLGDPIWAIKGADEDAVKQLPQPTQYAAVEIAFREKFYGLLVWCPYSTSIMAELTLCSSRNRRRRLSMTRRS